MPSSKNVYGPCVQCAWRKARYVDLRCEPCHFLAIAEKTQEKKVSPAAEALRKLVKDYHKLLRKGFNQTQIAQQWGMGRGRLAARLYKAKTSYGIKVLDGRTIRSAGVANVKPTVTVHANRSGHGEGLLGVKGCKCVPCVLRRRETRRVTDARYRHRRRLREAAAKAAQEQGEMTEKFIGPRSSEEEHAALNGGVGIS